MRHLTFVPYISHPDVFVPGFELVERSFEHLEHALLGHVVRLGPVAVLGPGAAVRVEDDGLLAHGDDAVDAVEQPAIDQLVDQHPGLGVQRLLRRGLVLLVHQSVLPLVLPDTEVAHLVVHLVADLE